jgi:plasmid stabilization system protein ParE
MSHTQYLLTETAEADFRAARNWSRKRWGNAATKRYFEDLHHTANQIASSHLSLPNSSDLTNSELLVWPVREHYIVYLPIPNQTIIIVALIRQSRDVPSILAANLFYIERELKQLKLNKITS